MSTNSRLKKEGIEIVEQLDTLKVNTIAISIASKLCLAFPEHNLNKSELFTSLSRINMNMIWTKWQSLQCMNVYIIFKNLEMQIII